MGSFFYSGIHSLELPFSSGFPSLCMCNSLCCAAAQALAASHICVRAHWLCFQGWVCPLQSLNADSLESQIPQILESCFLERFFFCIRSSLGSSIFCTGSHEVSVQWDCSVTTAKTHYQLAFSHSSDSKRQSKTIIPEKNTLFYKSE